jgi:2-dehydro-3-deoxyphosphooctonate aldolase (KDO 8-P synthase)
MGSKGFIIGAGKRKANRLASTSVVKVGLAAPMFVIAGPCVIEGKKSCLGIARRLRDISQNVGVPVIFKASFDKANRSSIKSFRGPGLKRGLEILASVRDQTGLPVMTDVHEPAQARPVAAVVDCLQVPAFLCRQTDLLCACARTGRPVNVKKGQFLSPAEMANVVGKIRACGNSKIMLTERGTFFGYNRLVNDMTAIESMKKLGCPVVFDATHSVQQPGGLGAASGGRRELAPVLAKAAVAAGANGLFLEVHPEVEKSKSDSASIMPLDWVEELLVVCKRIFETVRGR